MSYSYRRTRVNGTSAEFVVTLWKSKTWNLSQFSSCFIYELMLNSGDGGELQDLFVICHFDAVNRASVLGKPILET